jgi:hypothetical protein
LNNDVYSSNLQCWQIVIKLITVRLIVTASKELPILEVVVHGLTNFSRSVAKRSSLKLQICPKHTYIVSHLDTPGLGSPTLTNTAKLFSL